MIKTVAEIGCNHMGSKELAKELATIYSRDAGSDIIKFQKRYPKELLTEKQYNAPHPNGQHSFGNSYGLHREFLEFDINFHAELKMLIESYGKIYSTSVWDLTSAKEVVELNPVLIKVPSAKNNHVGILKYLRDSFAGSIHISLGMTTKEEEDNIINLFGSELNRVVLYTCTSGYPIKHSEACLLEIKRIKDKYLSKIQAIGYSGHHLGIALDIGAAVLMDCNGYIERHVTGYGGRTWKGTDQAASLEVDGFKKLKRDLQAIEQSFKYKEQDILEVEVEQRKKLKD